MLFQLFVNDTKLTINYVQLVLQKYFKHFYCYKIATEQNFTMPLIFNTPIINSSWDFFILSNPIVLILLVSLYAGRL